MCIKINSMKKISKRPQYKSLITKYINTLKTMESVMSDEEFKMVLDHDEISQELGAYIREEDKKFPKILVALTIINIIVLCLFLLD